MAAMDYEERRRENVQRNRTRMQSLGVKRLNVGPIRGKANDGRGTKKKKRSESDLVVAPRQSARLRNMPAISYALPEDYIVDEDRGFRNRSRAAKVSQPGDEKRAVKIKAAPAAPSPDSCRALRIDRAEWRDPGLVGQKLHPSGGLGPKAFVMASLKGRSSAGTLSTPRFSKYSGIQEWANAVVLFVNVSSKAGKRAYDNIFLDNFERMTWFAQKYHVEDTPVVQRLLRLTRDDAEEGGGEEGERESGREDNGALAAAPPTAETGQRDPVLLFCRREGEAYVFGGALKLDDFNPQARPLKFVWRLCHAGALRKSKDFLDIIEED